MRFWGAPSSFVALTNSSNMQGKQQRALEIKGDEAEDVDLRIAPSDAELVVLVNIDLDLNVKIGHLPLALTFKKHGVVTPKGTCQSTEQNKTCCHRCCLLWTGDGERLPGSMPVLTVSRRPPLAHTQPFPLLSFFQQMPTQRGTEMFSQPTLPNLQSFGYMRNQPMAGPLKNRK